MEATISRDARGQQGKGRPPPCPQRAGEATGDACHPGEALPAMDRVDAPDPTDQTRGGGWLWVHCFLPPKDIYHHPPLLSVDHEGLCTDTITSLFKIELQSQQTADKK